MVSFNSSPSPLATSSTTIDQNPTIASQSSVSAVKLGTWGGDGGSAFDLTVAPQRLESITIRWGKVIDWIAFSYRDRSGKLHTAGPWGGNGKGEGTETMTLEPSEYVTGVEWSVGPFTFKNVERCITRLKVVSNLRSFGPWGHGVDSTHHSLPVANGSVVGMFARAGDFLDAIGFYVLPGPAALVPAAAPVKPTTDDPEHDEKEKDSAGQEENLEVKEKDGSSQEEKEEKKSDQKVKEENGRSQEEKEEKKSDQEEQEKDSSPQAKEKESSHEAKENGKP